MDWIRQLQFGKVKLEISDNAIWVIILSLQLIIIRWMDNKWGCHGTWINISLYHGLDSMTPIMENQIRNI